MKQYKEYRDSGVEWLGNVPSHWEIGKSSLLFNTKKSSNANILNKIYCSKNEGEFPVYSGQTSNNGIMASINSYSFDLKDNSCFLVTTVGAKAMTIKKIKGKFNLSQNCMIILSNKPNMFTDYYYYYYLIKFKYERALIPQHMQPSFRMEDFESFEVITPPLEEQEQIANYLDHKVGAIDQLISKKKKQAQLLTENRKSIINDLITNGLNPDVDFKDTHIEYVGKIPKHWEFKKLDQMAIQNKVKNDDLQEKNLLSLSYGNIIRKDMNSNLGLLPANFKAYQIVQNGYIVLRLTDLQNDKKSLRVGLAKERGIITSAYVGLIFKSHNSRYIFFYLYVLDIKKVFYNLGAGVRQSLAYSELKNLLIPMPPMEEQEEIVKYLDYKTSIIDQLIEKVNKSIELLEEYKTSLISHVVTGKMKV